MTRGRQAVTFIKREYISEFEELKAELQQLKIHAQTNELMKNFDFFQYQYYKISEQVEQWIKKSDARGEFIRDITFWECESNKKQLKNILEEICVIIKERGQSIRNSIINMLNHKLYLKDREEQKELLIAALDEIYYGIASIKSAMLINYNLSEKLSPFRKHDFLSPPRQVLVTGHITANQIKCVKKMKEYTSTAQWEYAIEMLTEFIKNEDDCKPFSNVEKMMFEIFWRDIQSSPVEDIESSSEEEILVGDICIPSSVLEDFEKELKDIITS